MSDTKSKAKPPLKQKKFNVVEFFLYAGRWVIAAVLVLGGGIVLDLGAIWSGIACWLFAIIFLIGTSELELTDFDYYD